MNKTDFRMIFGTLAAVCFLYLLLIHMGIGAAVNRKLQQSPGGAQLSVAEDFIHARETPEYSGNTPEAEEFARHFSIGLRSWEKTASPSLPIPTYCFVRKDGFAILVLMPQMSQLSELEKREVEEFAWGLATNYASSKHPELKKVAICFMSNKKYLTALFGQDTKLLSRVAPVTDEAAVMLIRQLKPFFVPPEADNAE